MENSKQNKLNDAPIKVYSDTYADASYARVGFKGRVTNERGIIFSPYRKPNIFVRIFRKIKHWFRKPSKRGTLL